MKKEQKVIYYRDELNDEFAGDHIKAKRIDGDYRYLRKNFPGKVSHVFWYRIVAIPLARLYMKLHFHHKIIELRSRFPRDCAIIHRAVLSFGWLCNRVLYSVRRRNGQRFRIRSHQAFSGGGRRESCE